jgi:hypothetical protein
VDDRLRLVTALGIMVAVHHPGLLMGQTPPHLTGRVDIGLGTGSIAGDVCLAGVPVFGDTTSFVLNSALVVRSVSGAVERPVRMEAEPAGGAMRYWFVGASARSMERDAEPVTDLCIGYGGIEAVFDIESEEYRDDDASEVIAFNGRTIRARGASRWYPVPYEPATGLAAEVATFDLEVGCSDCRVIYVNGSEPLPGPVATFRSSVPRELLLVAGDLPVTESGDLRIIGEKVKPGDAERLADLLRGITFFLEGYVGVPYGPMPTILRLEPIRQQRPGQVWGFMSDPALALLGMPVARISEILSGDADAPRRTLTGFLAHELAHRYFGWWAGPRSGQRDLFGEPFATYLELKTVRHFFGHEEYGRRLDQLRARVVRAEEQTDLASSTAEDFTRASYRYAYAPLMLFTLEDTIGEAAMRRLLQALITVPSGTRINAGYEFLRESAGRAGVAPAAWAEWERRCGTGPARDNPCIRELGGSSSR